ncbi:serine hydrolase domain-containing protein [Streptomyces sp. NPDC050658]|uniref:serine hydrolase domain-containing protein n=1 Tax=unclassified Streptomyces TaxID=2593676 RepID=UPI0034246B3D
MPIQRTLQVIPLVVALVWLPAASAPLAAAPATDVTLPLLVTRGKAPAAALLTREDPWPRWHFTRATPATAGSDTASGTTADTTATTGPGTTPGIRRTDHFRAGSITKTFIATVVLQLAAEHRLSLSDPVEDHLPGLLRGEDLDGRDLTLRALLTHTSGLPDYTADTKGLVPLTPAQAVRTALARPATTPGRWSYSNTNYVVLGMVIKQVTGRSYATEAARRIITPLRLSGTSFPGARTTLPAPHGRAYSSEGEDVTALNPRVAGAAGELISTLADLDRFYAALLGGRLLPAAQLAQMLNTRATQGRYGMGLYPQKLPCGTTVWGHNGHIAGSYVRTAATRDGDRVLTYRVNTDGIADPTLEQTLLSAEFCT